MHKTKKICLVFLMASTTALFAQSEDFNVNEPSRMKEGLYVGVGVGGTIYHDTLTVCNTSTSNQISKSFNTTDTQASIFAGV